MKSFKQLNEDITTPNTYRTAAGYPGHEYWQVRADYDMKLRIDDNKQRLYGEETVTFYNNSPDALNYLWMELTQNVRALDSDSYKIQSTGDLSAQRGNEKMVIGSTVSSRTLENFYRDFDGGFKIQYVKDEKNKNVPYTINKTMMRIDVPEPIQSGDTYTFKIKWWYNINDHIRDGGRSGYEYFEDDDNYIYTIAQFFPRMCMYNDVYGWQNKQFLGRGEFTLIFGDYDVDGISSITILSSFFRHLNHPFKYVIPDRFIDGYGPNIRLLDQNLDKEIDNIIFLDCGSNSHDVISYLKTKKILK